MAYVLGFMYADGNIIINKRGAKFFAIYSADLELLQEIKQVMSSEHKISKRKGAVGNNYRIQFGSCEMYDDLISLGLRPNKTKRMRLPLIPSKYVGDFLRGYFDGDGGVWSGYVHKERKTSHLVIRVVFTSCSESFLLDLSKVLFKYCKTMGVLSAGKGNYFRLTYSTSGALILYKTMYNRLQSALFLPRKKQVFERYARIKKLRV